MDATPLNLGKLIPWKKALNILGIEDETGVLPCITRCPLCKGSQLTILYDTVFDSSWHYCHGCKVSGDMIQLAARFWNCNLKDAFAGLSAHLPGLSRYNLTDKAVDIYEKYFLGLQLSAQNFWKSISGRVIGTGLLSKLRLDMHVATDIDHVSWMEKGGKFVGAATREEIDEFVGILKDYSIFDKATQFEIRSYDAAVVIPFWDMPGRISAFMYIAPDSSGKLRSIAYRSVFPSYDSQEAIASSQRRCVILDGPGTCVCDITNSGSISNNDTRYILLGPSLAVRCQLKHLSDNPGDPLPIGGIQPEADETSILKQLSALGKVVFFSEIFGADIIRHAKAANGYVAANHVQGEDITTYLKRVTVKNWLKKLDEIAVPWEQALEDYLTSAAVYEAELLIARLKWDKAELSSFVNKCSDKVKQKLDRIAKKYFNFRMVRVEQHVIAETDNGWEDVRSDELICDAILRIEHILHVPDTKLNYYQGYIKYKEHILPFTVEQELFEASPFKWLDKFLIASGKGHLVYNRNYVKHAINIAKGFHSPDIVICPSNYGWDSVNSCFVLPGYSIMPAGEVIPNTMPIDNDSVGELVRPTTITKGDLALLTDYKADTLLLWRVLVVIVYNLMAPVFGYKAKGVVVSKNLLKQVTELAKAMGCTDKYPSPWPTLIKLPIHGESTRYRDTLECSGCIVSGNDYFITAAMTHRNWLMLKGKPVNIRPEVLSLAAKILPSYLKYRMTDQVFHKSKGNWLKWIKSSLRHWLSELNCSSEVLSKVFAKIGASSAIDAYLALLVELFELQLIKLPKRPRDLRMNLVMIGKDLVFIPKQVVNNALHKNELFAQLINVDNVSQDFSNSAILVNEIIHDGVPGWVIRYEDWRKLYSDRVINGKKKEVKDEVPLDE